MCTSISASAMIVSIHLQKHAAETVESASGLHLNVYMKLKLARNWQPYPSIYATYLWKRWQQQNWGSPLQSYSGCPGPMDILAQTLAFLVASHVVWGYQVVEAGVSPPHQLDQMFKFFCFLPCFHCWCMYNHKKCDAYASALWTCVDGITTWSDLSAVHRQTADEWRQANIN